MTVDEQIKQQLLNPAKLCRRSEILSKPSPVPDKAGIYAWYFKGLLDEDVVKDCHYVNGLPLLYIGISPSEPPQNGKPPSKQTLRKRLRSHLRGNSSTSTLRLSLGSLLARSLGIQLRRTGASERLTLTKPGEQILNQWLDEHAFVTWAETPQPWIAEPLMIRMVSLPLNLEHNKTHPFYPTLSQARAQARQNARDLPPVIER